MNTLTTSKANRQRKNGKKYEVTKIKVANKKKKAADKAVAKKTAWKKKGVKKNGKLVKGSPQHQEYLKAKAAAALAVDEAVVEGVPIETVYPPEA